MSKCYSRWRVNIVRNKAGRLKFTELHCKTCDLKLEDGKTPTQCGLSGFYSRRTAVQMGSLNSKLWETKEMLVRILAKIKHINRRGYETPEILFKHESNHRERILLLMHEKRNPVKYVDLVQWDENLKAEVNPL